MHAGRVRVRAVRAVRRAPQICGGMWGPVIGASSSGHITEFWLCSCHLWDSVKNAPCVRPHATRPEVDSLGGLRTVPHVNFTSFVAGDLKLDLDFLPVLLLLLLLDSSHPSFDSIRVRESSISTD